MIFLFPAFAPFLQKEKKKKKFFLPPINTGSKKEKKKTGGERWGDRVKERKKKEVEC